MKCKTREALELSLIPAAGRKMRQCMRGGAESSKRPIALVVSGLIVGALLGFAQPVRAEAGHRLPGQFNDDAYAALVNFGQLSTAAAPNSAVAGTPDLPDDVYHSALRGPAHPAVAEAPASLADGYAVLSDFVRSNAGAGSNLVADAGAGSVANPAVRNDAYSALVGFGQVSASAGPDLLMAKAEQPSKAKKVSAAAPAADDYAKGDPQTCLGCHGQDTHIQAFLKGSPMARKGDSRTPLGQGGCESCHGPSAAHVASRSKGGDGEPAVVFSGPHASPVEQRNAICQSCHTGGMLINWQGSQMERAGVACTNCHTVHTSEDPVQVRKTQPEVCFACHAEQRADSYKYSHHPIREGKVVCSDCHNPMGSAGPHLLKEFSVNETCYNCHADKRGPMLWEHQPVREDCTNCHTPHGSSEPRLMKENVGMMCTGCHSEVGGGTMSAFGGAHALQGNLQGKAIYSAALGNQRLCLNCHSQIHGSNSPSGAYFLR